MNDTRKKSFLNMIIQGLILLYWCHKLCIYNVKEMNVKMINACYYYGNFQKRKAIFSNMLYIHQSAINYTTVILINIIFSVLLSLSLSTSCTKYYHVRLQQSMDIINLSLHFQLTSSTCYNSIKLWPILHNKCAHEKLS